MYTYNAVGLRVAQSVDGDVTEFAWDWASGVPELLVTTESTNPEPTLYLVGHETLGQWDGSAWAYYLPDALGSVRQVTDGAGAVLDVREWTPYGVEVGAAQVGLGYTGEWWDASVALLYLRARWYAPEVGRFTSQDPLAGFPNRPETFHASVYAHDNPVNLTDHSGLAPWVDCTSWPTYLGLKELCQQANGDDNDSDVLNAREAILYTLARGGAIYGLAEEEYGYVVAAAMLTHFLGGNGSNLDLTFGLSSENAFVQDLGIARATRGLRDPQTGIATTDTFCDARVPGDEPDCITPLLWAFLQEHVQPVAGGGEFSVEPVHLEGTNCCPEPGARPYDTGFWAAFGHVFINGVFSARGKQSCHPEGYVIRYRADYRIDDNYEWFEGKKTPFDLPGAKARVWIPHEWELSLVRATPPRAHFYHFTISWMEKERILVGSEFTWYRRMAWWEIAF